MKEQRIKKKRTMNMLQIQFLDKNVVNALVPAFSMRPAHLIFFYDSRHVDDQHVINIESAIKLRLKETIVEFRQADMFSIHGMKEKLLKCMEDFSGESICIDITGGSELMIASGFMLNRQNGIQIVYTNLAEGYIFDVLTEEKIAAVKHMQIADYLIAIGAKHIKQSHTMPKEKEYDAICRVAEYIFENLNEWHALQQYLAGKYANSDRLDFEITTSISYNGEAYRSDRALEKFVENQFVEKKSHNRYRFVNSRYKEYMTVFGIWLELYVFIKGKDFFDEIHLGYIIDWDNADAKDTIDNEIDVLALRKSIPIFISCKMRKLEAMDLYEVAYLADRLGGPDAKGIVAATCSRGDRRNQSEGILKKLKKMHVGYIEAQSFRTHTTDHVFCTAMQGAE